MESEEELKPDALLTHPVCGQLTAFFIAREQIQTELLAGVLLPALILGQEHPWREIFDPKRKTLKAAARFIQGSCNAALQYMDWLTPGDKETIEALPPNEGIIIREGLKKLAVYKDEQHQVHINSAFCPHLGGCVRWNSGEKSWDCPCHGSRFSGCGKVMNGPSIDSLSPRDK